MCTTHHRYVTAHFAKPHIHALHLPKVALANSLEWNMNLSQLIGPMVPILKQHYHTRRCSWGYRARVCHRGKRGLHAGRNNMCQYRAVIHDSLRWAETLPCLTGYTTCAGRPCLERDPLFSNLPPCSCSSARFEDDSAPQNPLRGVRRRAVLTVDDPTAINRARIPARHPRHSQCPVIREEREKVPPLVCPCQKNCRHRQI
jgi:hypothetical protein